MNALQNLSTVQLIEAIARAVGETIGEEYSERLRGRVEIKLKRRFHELGLNSFNDYVEQYILYEKREFKHLVSALTVQSTQFFGEFSHFEYLTEHFLKAIIPIVQKRPDKTLHVWSAACSKGQEAYSLAMYLRHALNFYSNDLFVRVVGTDSDTNALKVAQNGAYHRSEMRDVPMAFLGNQWERVTVGGAEMLRARPALKNYVNFEYANLLGLKARFANQKFDLIFCRNVFTYFNESQIKDSCSEILSHLHPEGRFFVGISESLKGLDLPLRAFGPSIYGFKSSTIEQTVEVGTVSGSHLTKVFCVDDSPAVQTLMRTILRSNQGFEIVGSAMSINDVPTQLSLLKSADLVTVHLQGSEEGSLQYLEQYFDELHPPVLILSPDSQNDCTVLRQGFKFGHFEFVEKPILNQLNEQGESIRAKLRTLHLIRRNNVIPFGARDQFKVPTPLESVENKANVMVGGVSHLHKISQFLIDLKTPQPPIYIFFEGMSANLKTVAEELQRLSGRPCQVVTELTSAALPNSITVCDFRSMFMKVRDLHLEASVSIGILGEMGKTSSELVLSWSNAHLILEDLGQGEATTELKAHAGEIFPASSFAYLSAEYLK